MTISIWRYSHLSLAISSFLFILIASLTGIILAFEPISNQLKPYTVKKSQEQSLSKTITVLKKNHKELISIKVDQNNFIVASVIDNNGKNGHFYIDPYTGKKLGNLIEKAPLYKFATSLHRSLFLKSTGRFIIGFVSLLLLLIACTGTLLIIKRQGGLKRLFSNVVDENFEQYYHILIGKYTFIPIVIITITGVYLSLDKFSLLPSTKITHHITTQKKDRDIKTKIVDFTIFKNIYLKDLKSIEFPFSPDEEDYFYIKLTNKELLIHQYSGEILSNQTYSIIQILKDWSLFLHTGRGNIFWSIILLLTCFSILFFIYSGFAMTIRRKKKTLLPKNRINKDKAEYIILVGSETGSTYSFATSLYDALIDHKKTVFISSLNEYNTYQKGKYLIILTATYGEGEAPSNASNFKKLLLSTALNNTIHYSVVGFGSLAYPDYCKYAIELDTLLQNHTNCISTLPIYKINNQSFNDFKEWTHQWSAQVKTPLLLKQPAVKKKKEKTFTVIKKTIPNNDNSFLLHLKPSKKTKFFSGDLLSIIPKEDNMERLYSIGRINDNILLSIKRHDLGICSNYFNQLHINDIISASIKKNTSFHFPKNIQEIILISNGTGIAPFLGMINENRKCIQTHLFWGGRTTNSFKMYSEQIYRAYNNKQLSSIHIAYSQEKDNKNYVQNLVLNQPEIVTSTLKKGGVIMICGSVAMMNATLKVLDKISLSELNTSLDYFHKNNQIKTDCY